MASMDNHDHDQMMKMMMPLPKLQNIVSTAKLGCALNLKRIAMRALNAEYSPKRFCAVVMRIRSPKTTALIFSNGKLICTGAKSEQDSLLAVRKYVKIIQKVGYPDATCAEFKIQNLVASCDAGFVIRLEKVACSSHSGFISYEPELFPGLIYRMKEPRVTVAVFASGKIVIAGAKRREEAYAAVKNIFPVLQAFKK